MKTRAFLTSAILTMLLIGFVSVTSYAQTTSKEKGVVIKGTVVNATTGNPVSDIEVSLQDTDMSATTDSKGQFSIDGVEPGKYVVTIQDSEYKEFQQTIDVKSSDVDLKIKLQPESDNSDD